MADIGRISSSIAEVAVNEEGQEVRVAYHHVEVWSQSPGTLAPPAQQSIQGTKTRAGTRPSVSVLRRR